LTSTVNGVLAQRLVRKLCRACRQPYRPTPELGERLGLGDVAAVTLYRPVGCKACSATGYAGRTMISELMPMTDAIRPLVLRRAEARELQAQAIGGGMQTMYARGIKKALAGITTIEEVIRVTRDV
jgi:general secretion pathway protein E